MNSSTETFPLGCVAFNLWQQSFPLPPSLLSGPFKKKSTWRRWRRLLNKCLAMRNLSALRQQCGMCLPGGNLWACTVHTPAKPPSAQARSVAVSALTVRSRRRQNLRRSIFHGAHSVRLSCHRWTHKVVGFFYCWHHQPGPRGPRSHHLTPRRQQMIKINKAKLERNERRPWENLSRYLNCKLHLTFNDFSPPWKLGFICKLWQSHRSGVLAHGRRHNGEPWSAWHAAKFGKFHRSNKWRADFSSE